MPGCAFLLLILIQLAMVVSLCVAVGIRCGAWWGIGVATLFIVVFTLVMLALGVGRQIGPRWK